jgi:hypothetical protein
VDRVDGYAGHELRFEGRRLVTRYLRVGFEPEGRSWRMHKLRPDFNPADKVQMEDDITGFDRSFARLAGCTRRGRDGLRGGSLAQARGAGPRYARRIAIVLSRSS